MTCNTGEVLMCDTLNKLLATELREKFSRFNDKTKSYFSLEGEENSDRTLFNMNFSWALKVS